MGGDSALKRPTLPSTHSRRTGPVLCSAHPPALPQTKSRDGSSTMVSSLCSHARVLSQHMHRQSGFGPLALQDASRRCTRWSTEQPSTPVRLIVLAHPTSRQCLGVRAARRRFRLPDKPPPTQHSRQPVKEARSLNPFSQTTTDPIRTTDSHSHHGPITRTTTAVSASSRLTTG